MFSSLTLLIFTYIFFQQTGLVLGGKRRWKVRVDFCAENIRFVLVEWSLMFGGFYGGIGTRRVYEPPFHTELFDLDCST